MMKLRIVNFLIISGMIGHVACDEKFHFQGGNKTNELWTRALTTMSFHRDMMNEYLCRNYLANEILNLLKNQTIDRRLGEPASDVRLKRESLLHDSGSKNYKDWLSRSTTLEDIYRHYEGISGEESSLTQESQATSLKDDEITGYALIDGKVDGNGLGDLGTDYGYHHYEHIDEEDDYYGKGMKPKEIFDLALTAIAFLAFGTFITEVMICALGVQTQEAQMMIVSPVTSIHGLSFKSNDDDASIPSGERRSFSSRDIPIDIINEMSRRVLSSIKALMIANHDEGKCLRTVLCESNKYSKDLPGSQKLWIPLWSFGISWISERFFRRKEYSLLENLKAALFGFNNADCVKLYGKCKAEARKKRK